MGGLPANKTVNGLAVDPKDPRVMYVVMRDGIFKSTDAAVTWKPMGKRLKDLVAVAVNPKKQTEIYTATGQGTIFKSPDGGTKWEQQK